MRVALPNRLSEHHRPGSNEEPNIRRDERVRECDGEKERLVHVEREIDEDEKRIWEHQKDALDGVPLPGSDSEAVSKSVAEKRLSNLRRDDPFIPTRLNRLVWARLARELPVNLLDSFRIV